MALKKGKSEATLALEIEAEMQRRAKARREDNEIQEACDLFSKEHNLVTKEDHINFIKTKLARSSVLSSGKKDALVEPKKSCLNCGSIKIFRQRDMAEATLVWTDKYLCGNCKETFVL